MEYIKDLVSVMGDGARKTINSIRFLPLLILLQALVSVLHYFVFGLFVIRGGLFGGILAALLRAALWSVYLYGLYHAVHGYKFGAQDLRAGTGAFFRDVYIAAFVLWIVQMLIGMIRIPYAGYLLLLVFSALPETIYLGRYAGFDNIRDSFEFLRENGYIWIPLTILMILLLERVSIGVSLIFPWFSGLIPNFLILFIIHSVLFGLFALFRGQLFRILYGSSIRKRRFMGKFR